MTTGRIYQARLTGTVEVRGRIYQARLTGTAPAATKGRIYQARLTGTGAVLLAPFADRAVEPLSPQTITAVLAPGSIAPDSYIWRVVDEPGSTSVVLTGTGATVTCRAPAGRTGAFVVIGVRAVKGAQSSPERTIRILSLPQIMWHLNAAGQWVPVSPTVAL
jgi:hypothetical protein